MSAVCVRHIKFYFVRPRRAENPEFVLFYFAPASRDELIFHFTIFQAFSATYDLICHYDEVLCFNWLASYW